MGCAGSAGANVRNVTVGVLGTFSDTGDIVGVVDRDGAIDAIDSTGETVGVADTKIVGMADTDGAIDAVGIEDGATDTDGAIDAVGIDDGAKETDGAREGDADSTAWSVRMVAIIVCVPYGYCSLRGSKTESR
jgi:hypothetical protein